MTTELMKGLLEAGVHFGHQTKRWNPKMSKFIFGERSNIHIIDLEKTQECMGRATKFLRDLASKGEHILFIGTKKQAQDVIVKEATRCGMPYVSRRWLGGLLTNFQTVQRSVNRLKELEGMREGGVFESLSKKEVSRLSKEIDRLRRNLGGVLEMANFPAALFLIDSKRETTAVQEANKLSIPIVALIDTNCDPTKIQYPIPGNDDAVKSVKFITSIVADAVLEGRKKYLESKGVEEAIKEKELKLEPEAEEKHVVTVSEEHLTEEEKLERARIKGEIEKPIKTKMKPKREAGPTGPRRRRQE